MIPDVVLYAEQWLQLTLLALGASAVIALGIGRDARKPRS